MPNIGVTEIILGICILLLVFAGTIGAVVFQAVRRSKRFSK